MFDNKIFDWLHHGSVSMLFFYTLTHLYLRFLVEIGCDHFLGILKSLYFSLSCTDSLALLSANDKYFTAQYC